MISGKRLRCATIALLLSSPTTGARAAKPEVEALLASLAPQAAGEVAFVEIRWSHLVKRPLRSSGVLRRGDGVLEKRVAKPRVERVAIDRAHATVERNGGTRRIALARAPELAALRTSFEALMDGDAAALERHFDATLARDGGGWTLTLVPRDPKLAKRATIEVSGAADRVRCVGVREPDDDLSLMLLGDAAGGLGDAPARDAAMRHCRAPG
jgi:hypothetical protein